MGLCLNTFTASAARNTGSHSRETKMYAWVCMHEHTHTHTFKLGEQMGGCSEERTLHREREEYTHACTHAKLLKQLLLPYHSLKKKKKTGVRSEMLQQNAPGRIFTYTLLNTPTTILSFICTTHMHMPILEITFFCFQIHP